MRTLLVLTLVVASWTARSAQACILNSECDDANVCNGAETCQAGVCIPGTDVTCDDGNPCTIDTCDTGAGCTFTPANGCLLEGKKLRLGSGRYLTMGLDIAPQMTGIAFPANNTNDDPVENGASLRVFSTVGGFDDTYPMPMGRWEYLGVPGVNKGYRYKDFHNESGPITSFAIKNGHKSKLKARGALNFSLATDPEPVTIVLRFGNNGRQFCLEFGGRTKFYLGKRYDAEASPAPTACP